MTMTLEDQRIKTLIIQYDDSIRYRKKLLDCYFAEALLSIIPICMENKDTLEAKIKEKLNECEKLKICLERARRKIAKLFAKHEDNTHMREYLDFAIFLVTFRDSNEDTGDISKLDDDSLLRRCDISMEDITNDDEPNGLLIDEIMGDDEFKSSKIPSNIIANEEILALNSKLKTAYESLDAEKSERERIEIERDNLNDFSDKLSYLLFKYQKLFCVSVETRGTNTQTIYYDDHSYSKENFKSSLSPPINNSSPDDRINTDPCEESFNSNLSPPINNNSSPDDQITTNSCAAFEYEFSPSPSPPPNFQDVSTLLESIDSVSTSPNIIELNPVVLDETSIQYEVQNFETVPESNFLLNVSTPLTPIISNRSYLRNAFTGTPINHHIHPTQEDALKVIISNLAPHTTSPKRSEMNDNLASQISGSFIPFSNVSPIKLAEKRFRCENCGKSFPMQNSEEKLVKCPICDVNDNDHGDENKRKLPIVVSKRKRNGKSDDFSEKSQNKISSLCCNICGRHYSSKYILKTHVRMVHNGEKPYKCTECGKRFAQKSDLKKHTLVHGSERPFKCSVCNVGFKNWNAKTRHERIVHERGAHLQCAHCDKRLYKKEQLISHIHTKHFSAFQKQFKCTICDKSFALKWSLQSHKFTHTSKKSFKCSFCDRYFKFPNDKVKHEKTIHGKRARFRCKHCDKVYILKAFLIRHLQNNHAE